MSSRLNSSFHLVLALVGRDLQARYRRSLLGPAWAVLQPLLLMVLFTMMSRFVGIPSDGTPYAVFSFSALVPWTFFANGVALCGPSISNNASILKKMALPREVFPVAAVAVTAFDFLVAFVLLAGMMVHYRLPFTAALLWVPALAGLSALLALGVGMFVASVGTYRRDVLLATPFLMQLWLFATPVIYPMSSVPARYRGVYALNPMAGIVEGFRSVLLHGQAPRPDQLLCSAAVCAAVFLASWALFRPLSRYFADVL